MATPKCTQNAPYVIEEKPGKKAWCACGLSGNQPYCDGAHKECDLTPVVVEIEKEGNVAWCGCRKTSTPPYCDGTHAS